MQNLTRRLTWIFLSSIVLFNSTAHAQNAELVVQTGHTSQIDKIIISPNGKVVASQDHTDRDTIKIWSVESGKETGTLHHSDYIQDIVFSPDSRFIYATSLLGFTEIKKWDVLTSKEVDSYTCDGSDTVRISPDARLYLCREFNQSSEPLFSLWETENKRNLWKIPVGKEGGGYSVSPDWKRLFVEIDNSLKVIDIKTGKEIAVYKEKRDFELKQFDIVDNGKAVMIGSGNTRSIFGNHSVIWKPDSDRIIDLKIPGQFGRYLDTDPASSKFILKNNEKNLIYIFSFDDLNHPLQITLHPDSPICSVQFSDDDKFLFVAESEGNISKISTGNGMVVKKLTTGNKLQIYKEEFGNTLQIGGDKKSPQCTVSVDTQTEMVGLVLENSWISVWDWKAQKQINSFGGVSRRQNVATFSPDGKYLASGGVEDGAITLFSLAGNSEARNFAGHKAIIYAISFSPDGTKLASADVKGIIILWDVKTGRELRRYNAKYWIREVAFNPEGTLLASADEGGRIRLWSIADEKEVLSFKSSYTIASSVTFSPDGKFLLSGGANGECDLWDAKTGKHIRSFEPNTMERFDNVAFSKDGKYVLAAFLSEEHHRYPWVDLIISAVNKDGKMILTFKKLFGDTETEGFPEKADGPVKKSDTESVVGESTGKSGSIFIWERDTGKLFKSLEQNGFDTLREISTLAPSFYKNISLDKGLVVKRSVSGNFEIHDINKAEKISTLFTFIKDNWAVVDARDRFDTNEIEKPEGLHWIVSDQPFKPLPLEVFMRQYFEPNLLSRILNCTQTNTCEKEFKALPSIAEINRVQPKVEIRDIRSSGNGGLADVTVEVENVTEELSVSAENKTRKKEVSSGAYDLRLFRDGQLVGVSTPKDKLAQFIHDAPRLVAETKASGKLIDTPEDRAWREANDIFKLRSENIKFVSETKAKYTFCNIKLPRDGRKEVEFTAYAFNSDKVKSTTTEPVKFTIPAAISGAQKKGRAFVVSIGVNASENPAYNLRYAANDARKMQEIVGARLKAANLKYAEVVQIPLVSDYDINKNIAENTAQKAIIKGVFSLLVGHKDEVPADILKQIPNRDRIKTIEPEDTLIISFSGHGYADQAGIFYLLPYDIGRNTTKLTPDALQKTISSDELSLWMQEITAMEMIMIIDACHSAAAVQGEGFKPGPMGSRGLGQLAYDKGMKILSATQADNVALELNSLEQGLLSYALLQDGIVKTLADADKDKQLFPTEWLSYAEKRVPELYQEVKDGKHTVIFNGKSLPADRARTEIINLSGNKQSNTNLQQPSLFDFKKRNTKKGLFNLT